MPQITRPTIRSASRPTRRASTTRRAVSLACMSAGLLGVAAAPALASTFTMTDLGSLGYGTTYGTAINASGQITGESYLGTEVQVPCATRHDKPPCFTHPGHGFLWSNGAMTDLGTLGGLDSGGNAINDLGEVVGTSNTSNATSAFTDQKGVMTAINSGDPTAINDSGEIAGGGAFPVETQATCSSRRSPIRTGPRPFSGCSQVRAASSPMRPGSTAQGRSSAAATTRPATSARGSTKTAR
jgi:probable HAF family extracellular repeat protein